MITRSLLALVLLWPASASAGELTVAPVTITDFKPVYATVESTNVAEARARIGGTVVDLRVDEGAEVTQGQIIAVVGDDKLALQLGALEAQMAAARAQQEKAHDDYVRAQELFGKGAIPKAQLDATRAAFDVADNQLKSANAQRSVTEQQMKEGQILAPAAGRVLTVPVTKGMVVMPGEIAARIATDNYILRLQLPERHAPALKVGAPIRLEDGRSGTIRQVYPEITGGRVQADAEVPALDAYFVGQRLPVEVSVGTHQGFVVPPAYIITLAGIDYVTLKQDARPILVPVQRGQALPEGVEIISGLRAGDVLLEAEK